MTAPVRLGVTIRGVVQGVGFRPFVHAAATRRGLSGWVRDRSDGVALEVQGAAVAVRDFVELLRRERPPAARVGSFEVVDLEPAAGDGFRILPSTEVAPARAILPADLAPCVDCSAEVADPGSRRYRYPFTSCACCGPRLGVIEALPYDRARTSMREFALCAACAREYAAPADRRFHAQTVACPSCGPRLRLIDASGRALASEDAALRAAAAALRAGAVVAVQGLGGFQLLADATDAAVVACLRARKRRPEKPFAVLFASLDGVRAACAPPTRRRPSSRRRRRRSSSSAGVRAPRRGWRPSTGSRRAARTSARCCRARRCTGCSPPTPGVRSSAPAATSPASPCASPTTRRGPGSEASPTSSWCTTGASCARWTTPSRASARRARRCCAGRAVRPLRRSRSPACPPASSRWAHSSSARSRCRSPARRW